MSPARSRSAALRGLAIAGLAGVMLLSSTGRGADAQERPPFGGELLYVVPTEPASYDGHREGTFALIHPLACIYSTVLRFDPTDRTGTKIVGELDGVGLSE